MANPEHDSTTPAAAAGLASQETVSLGGVAVEVRGLTVALGERLLLEDASARFEAGHVTLIVGVSGAGKTTLLRLLAGLLSATEPGVRVAGHIDFGGQALPPEARCRRVGVVFQSPALFDELSPADNIRLALAHRAPATHAEGAPGARALLEELQVPADVRTASLSGGQRQRLAIARTLAYDPDVILYDEPTAGLDAVTAAQVARLIRATHTTHPKTSIVVTHDYRALAPIADRIYFLDPETRSLREIERGEWPHLESQLHPVEAEGVGTAPSRPAACCTGTARRWVARGGDFLAGTADVAAQALATPLWLLPLWRSPFWGLRFLGHYLRLIAGPSAWAYLALAGFVVGFVNTYFVFRFLPFDRYTKPLLIEDLLIALGFALYRIFVPVLATILVAARCGAAVAADVGGKSYGHQIDALRTLGVPPRRYLLTPILYSFLIGTPLLTFVSYWAAATTSLVVFTAGQPGAGPDFWDLHFHRRLVSPDQTLFMGTGWLLAKVLLCAAGTASIAYHQGARRKYSTRNVSTAITSTILWSTLFVLAVHFAFAFFEFERDRLDVLWPTE